MDAIKFIKERNRMCATYTPKRCEECPANNPNNYGGEGIACIMVDKIDAERLVPIVEAWSAAHPRKTRQSVFLEQYPEAKIEKDGCLGVCPYLVSASHRGRDGLCAVYDKDCIECRHEFWPQEVE